MENKEKKIGPYTIIRRLTHSGMSEVYLASDDQGEQLYALKTVPFDKKEYCQRFQREVQVVSKLEHPHILPVIDASEEDGLCYCVFHYIEQGTLRDRIIREMLSIEEAGQILSQIAEALQFTHEKGLLHRDIKSTNILVNDQQWVWLTDFGLVSMLEGSSGLTDTGCLIGTPSYIAPELMEHQASIQSDLYALGMVAYEMLTGRVAFTGSNPATVCWKQQYEIPVAPSTLNPLVPLTLDQVLLRALAKQPEDRYPTALAFAEAFNQALCEEEDTQVSCFAVSRQRKTRPQSRKPVLISLVAALLLFLFGILSLSALSIPPESGNKLALHALNAKITSTAITPQASASPTSTPTSTPSPQVTGSNEQNNADSENDTQKQVCKKNNKHGKAECKKIK